MAAARLLFILSLLRIIVYMKKLSACLCAFLFSLWVFALPAQAVGYQPSYDVKAAAAYIVNLDTNLIVYDHNSEESLAADSLTKAQGEEWERLSMKKKFFERKLQEDIKKAAQDEQSDKQ